jgi:titin
MDAAIARTSTADVGIATPADGYGAPSPATTAATLGLPVQKYGRTTGLQLGSVAGTNISVDVCYIAIGDFCLQEARFAGQVSVSPGTFAAPGDSGSLIVTQGSSQPVALLFAGGDGLAIGTPIDLVLQRFGVTIEGAQTEGPPSAPTGLAAFSGDATATLSWNAPGYDGGSPVLGYRIYRGTTPGSETFLQSVGTVTTFTDTNVVNGTTYSYRVSAENANGEGALSSAASATPTDLVPPEPLVTVDAFDRGFENPLSDGGRWTNGVNGSGESGLYVPSVWAACSKSTTCTAWRNATQYGPDAEVWARVSTLAGDNNHVRLYLRLQQVGGAGYDGYMLRTNQLPGTDQVWLERIDNGAFVNRLTIAQELTAGDTLLFRAKGSTLEAWRNDGSTWTRLGVAVDTTYAGPGFTGIGLRGTTGRLDDFGARTLGAGSPPGTPTGVSAVAGDAAATVSWSPPAFDGGSPVTGYRIYRGIPPDAEAFVASVGSVTSFVDSDLVNGTTYAYRVSAVSAIGEGALSSAVTVTPSAAVEPAAPLPTTDGFDRANENPLSDAGRWSNGVIGSVETGHFTTGGALACSKTTTCTAWRNATQYGPDTEVWTRVSALAGENNHVRLYARLQQAGSSAYDGYMLRTNQLAGTDQVYLERVDNGSLVNRLTIARELAAGDLLLLRALGSQLEAWLHDGSSWSRLGAVTDTTYAGAGLAGIGLRGTTGRLDDFGARTYGDVPPPPTAPSAPQGLVAVASDGFVRLTWQPPADTGGSAITGYRIYRGTAPGTGVLLQSTAVVTSFDDTTVTNETTYYYTVSAENAVGEGSPTGEVSARPSNLVLPLEPLPTVDAFNRPNERPLSDGGRWGDGINGAGERSLKVASNQLASDRTTTATAWRKDRTYGPDVETWVTVRTMPGNGNWLRLYVRLQQPGSSAHDGYMLVVTQASGVDQWSLERVTNYTWTNIAAGSADVAVGNRVLLRAVGTTVEAWIHTGAGWSRILRASDATYTGAGYVGVGLRAKTGRLDDFGAR